MARDPLAALPAGPPPDCPLCPRMVALRYDLRGRHADWHNQPVAAHGDRGGWLAIVGLAPGERGANRTGRPFTGDPAGDLLTAALADAGLWADDAPVGCLVTNAVACLPPGNRPTPAEIHACRPFLVADLRTMPNLAVVVALGHVAHQSAVKALGGKLPKHPFAHAAEHRLHTGYLLLDCYHPSQRNQTVGRITAAMLGAVLDRARHHRPA